MSFQKISSRDPKEEAKDRDESDYDAMSSIKQLTMELGTPILPWPTMPVKWMAPTV